MNINFTTNINCIVRLLQYKSALQRLKKMGFVRIFSDNLADATDVLSSRVRKDFSLFGVTGNKKGGYLIDELLTQLNRVLGKEAMQKVVIVGAGKIGTALMEYAGLPKEGFEVAAAFDINPQKCSARGAVPVHPFSKLADFIGENGIKLGIIAVPGEAAQQAFDIMIGAGIRGILNFAPVQLKATPEIVVSNVNIAMELEKLWYCVKMS